MDVRPLSPGTPSCDSELDRLRKEVAALRAVVEAAKKVTTNAELNAALAALEEEK